MRNRLAIRYAVEGDLRFISHHDSLRLFERALTRARIPLRYSEGFNPKPRISIVLPRPVGVASLDELLVVELASETAPSEVLSRLRQEMPPGITLTAAESLEDKESRQPREAWYSLEIDSPTCEAAAKRAEEFLSRERATIRRACRKSKTDKLVDIRSYVTTIEVAANRVTWAQAVTPEGTARPGEILAELGLPGRDHLHRLCRLKVAYQPQDSHVGQAIRLL